MDHNKQNRGTFGTTMAVEVVGVCVLTGILDLVLHHSLSVKHIDQCVDTVVKHH